MNQTKLTTEELADIPEVELMVDVMLIPDDGGAPEPVQASAGLDDVLDGDRPPTEEWDDGGELSEFLDAEGSKKRWMPRALMVGGAMALLAGVLVVAVGQSSEAAERESAPAPEASQSIRPAASPQQPAPVEPAVQEEATPGTRESSPNRKHRSARARKARSREDLRKQVMELMGVDRRTAPAVEERIAPPMKRARNTNTPMFLASRIYRHNKRTLLACDRLAQRRGENLTNSRALFQISVNARGDKSVKVTGKGVPQTRLSCYRVMSQRWRLPQTSEGYQTVFQHIN